MPLSRLLPHSPSPVAAAADNLSISAPTLASSSASLHELRHRCLRLRGELPRPGTRLLSASLHEPRHRPPDDLSRHHHPIGLQVLRNPSHTCMPASATSTTSCSLMNCLKTSCHVSIGTPATAVSSTEFHPQWLRNAPTAGCARIAACGAHPNTTIPLPATLRSHPSGIHSPPPLPLTT